MAPPKRNLRVTKWFGTVPVIAVCSVCTSTFKVPLTALNRVAEAQKSLQLQFDTHQCKPDEKAK
jgi:hypothetical protein